MDVISLVVLLLTTVVLSRHIGDTKRQEYGVDTVSQISDMMEAVLLKKCWWIIENRIRSC